MLSTAILTQKLFEVRYNWSLCQFPIDIIEFQLDLFVRGVLPLVMQSCFAIDCVCISISEFGKLVPLSSSPPPPPQFYEDVRPWIYVRRFGLPLVGAK